MLSVLVKFVVPLMYPPQPLYCMPSMSPPVRYGNEAEAMMLNRNGFSALSALVVSSAFVSLAMMPVVSLAPVISQFIAGRTGIPAVKGSV